MARTTRSKNTPRALRSIALALPEAMEDPNSESSCFRVRGKAFARAGLDGAQAMLNLPVELQQAMLAEHPDAFSLPPGARARGSTLVAIDKIDREFLAALVASAWVNGAPRGLTEAHVAGFARSR